LFGKDLDLVEKRLSLELCILEDIYEMAYRGWECMDILNFEELHGKSRRSH